MPTNRPSRPWRITWYTTDGSSESAYRSEAAKDRAIDEELQKLADGLSRVTRFRVEKWEGGRWYADAQTSLGEA